MIRHLCHCMEPLTVGECATIDSRVTVTTFARHVHDAEGFHTGGPTVMHIIREHLGLNRLYRLSHMRARGEERSDYKGSGEWSYYRPDDGRAIVISVDVGCHCEHDCCGHMCSLHHRIEQNGSMTIVTTSRGFNY